MIGLANGAANSSVVLSNANDFTGGTTLNGGTLALGNNHALGTGTLTINGGELRINTSPALENPLV